MTVSELESLARLLKTARENKGLSQRALAERVGIPQSHISKIENAAVDLQTSSLMQIARALDLEIALIPRGALPAVQALNAARPAEVSPHLARLSLEWDRVSSRTAVLASRHPKDISLQRLVQTLAQIRALRFDLSKEQARQMLRLIEDLKGSIRKLRRLPASTGGIPLDLRSEIEKHERQLRDLRNAMAHGMNPPSAASIPAYRLVDDDEREDEESNDG